MTIPTMQIPTMQIPTDALTLDDVPRPDAARAEIIRFAQTLNGYQEVGGQASDLGAYVAALKTQTPSSLSLNDLRMLLFARQRAHYHQGGGWPDGDPIMEQMRAITAEIRSRLDSSG